VRIIPLGQLILWLIYFGSDFEVPGAALSPQARVRFLTLPFGLFVSCFLELNSEFFLRSVESRLEELCFAESEEWHKRLESSPPRKTSTAAYPCARRFLVQSYLWRFLWTTNIRILISEVRGLHLETGARRLKLNSRIRAAEAHWKIHAGARAVKPVASPPFAYDFFKRHIPEVESILSLLISSTDQFLLDTHWRVLRFAFSSSSRKWMSWVSSRALVRRIQGGPLLTNHCPSPCVNLSIGRCPGSGPGIQSRSELPCVG